MSRQVSGRPQNDFSVERFDQALTEEKGFIISELQTSISSNGGTFNIHMSNPSGSGRSAIIDSVSASASELCTAKIIDSFSTAPSGGSSVNIDNLLMDTGGGTDSGKMNASQDVSFTGDNTHATAIIGSGQGGNTVGATGTVESFVIEPDREIVVELTNNSSNSARATVTSVYFEIPEVYTS